jgi:hypothetical protein
MNQIEALLSKTPTEVPTNLLIINILLTAFFSLILGWFYIRFGQSLSNRTRLARNFTLVAITTTLIITIVKSSLALSLGLVGALSIVRFRAAIKEPEDLGFLFLAITLGLGFGANQPLVTMISFTVILAVLYVQHLFHLPDQKENLFLNIRLTKNSKTSLEKLLKNISNNVVKLDVRRVEDTKKELNLGCLVELSSTQELEDLLKLLRKNHPGIHILLIDSFV